jgi:VWFA-related protein
MCQWRPFSSILLVFLASGSLTSAQETNPSDAAVFGTEVSIVSVPVFVVDKKGHAMRGLQPQDFELYDDKGRMPIVSFQYVDTTSPESQEAIREAPAARRRFVLLFDLSFTDPAGIMRARRAARELVLRRLAPSDLAAVAVFDVQRGARLVANFTENKSLLLHAVDTLGVPSLSQIRDPLSLALNPTEATTDFAVAGGAINDDVERAMAQRLRATEENIYAEQVLQLLGGLESLAQGLGTVVGRKQVLYFSAGFDSQILIGTTGSEQRLDTDARFRGRHWEVDAQRRFGDTRLRSVFSDVAKSLANADSVVHSIDVTGLGRESSLTQVGVTTSPSRLANASTSGRESLSYLASETGGRFFKDSNDLDVALGEVLAMTSRYYILGYQPEDLQGPGQFHKLKVKVKRKGSKVSHRAGYYERVPRPAQTALQRQFESAQLVMTGVGPNRLHFDALCLPFPSRHEKQMLGAVLQVPKDQLRWKTSPVELEVYGYAVAADGSVVDHMAQSIRIDPALADPDARVHGISFAGRFDVPPGEYTLKFMIQEIGSGESGVQFIDVSVPAYDSRQGFLLPPMVADDVDRWLGIRSERSTTAFPFSTGAEPFLPRASFRVQNGAPERLVLISYLPDKSRHSEAPLEIHSSVTDAQGVLAPAGSLKLDHIERDVDVNRRTYDLTYTPQDLAPGTYTLRLSIGEAGQQFVEAYTLLRVGS